jgi:DNA-binding GntR family transcriptional regulator
MRSSNTSTDAGKDSSRFEVGGTRSRLARIVAANLEESAYNAIKEAILNLEFRPGDPLIEAAIAAELAVSKTPVREALIRLEREGLVEVGTNRGRTVVRLSSRDVQEVFEIRGLLEGHLARGLAPTAPESLLNELEESIIASESATRAGDRRAYFAYVRKFDRILYDASPNRRMVPLLHNFQDLLDIIGAISTDATGRAGRSNLEHRRILAALRARDPNQAAERMSDHVQSVLRDYLGVMEHPSVSASI